MKALLAAAAALLGIVSCAPSTPQQRIARHPEKLAGLRPAQRVLVEKGEIARGMPADAVYLAWGEPDRRFEGLKGGRRTARWDYAGAQPVYHTQFSGGFGYGGWGPYARGRYSAFSVGPEVSYVPVRLASVWFVDDRVDGWERVR